jgi:hypothetical protein
MQFKVGDRVRINQVHNSWDRNGQEGRVAKLENHRWRIEFETPDRANHYYINLPEDELELIEPETRTAGKVMMRMAIDDARLSLHPMFYPFSKDFDKPLIVSDWDCDIAPRKKPIMSRLNNMMKRLLDSDTQTLVKAGYINGDLELTDKGQEALDSVLFAANKAELVTLAQADLNENQAA